MFTARFATPATVHGDHCLSIARIAGAASLLLVTSCTVFFPSITSDPSPAEIGSLIDRQFDSGRAMEDLRFITQYWRIPGGPGYDASLARIESQLETWTRIAFEGHPLVTLKPFDDPARRKIWVPEDAVLSMESPEIQVIHTFSATPVMLCENSFSADVTAPLVYVPGGNKEEHYSQFEVSGRIVLCDAAASQAYRLAMARGALGVISCFVPAHNRPAEYPDIIAESGIPYDAERKPFAINISPRTAQELKQRIRNTEVKVRVQTKTTFKEGSIKTLQAEIPGRSKPNERIVLVAHVDHYKPGANDNASGAATLLEILRSVATAVQNGDIPPPARTMTFLWVDEYRGTSAWMKRNSEHLGEIAAAFVLDMVGGDPAKTGGLFRIERMPDPGTIWLRAPDRHSGWGTGSWNKDKLFGNYLNDYYLAIVAARSKSTGWQTTENVWEGGSDHDPFLWRGIPAVLSWHFPDYAYHTSLDAIENISPREIKNAGVSIGTAAYQLALGSESVARIALQAVDTAWTKRLETIRLLATMELTEIQSADARSLDAVRQHEKQILEAWGLWYDQALESVLRIPAILPSPHLADEVRLRRERNQQALSSLKSALGL